MGAGKCRVKAIPLRLHEHKFGPSSYRVNDKHHAAQSNAAAKFDCGSVCEAHKDSKVTQRYFFSAVRGKLRQRTVSLYRSMSYGLFCPGTI